MSTDTIDTKALLACPFCGYTDAVRLSDGDSWDSPPDREPMTWAVVCDYNRGGCGGSGGFRDSQKDAIAAWNQAAERLVALQSLCAQVYQAAGAFGMPERVLDVLSDAANGDPIRHANILPVDPPAPEVRIAKLELENARLRDVISRTSDSLHEALAAGGDA